MTHAIAAGHRPAECRRGGCQSERRPADRAGLSLTCVAMSGLQAVLR